MLLMIQACNSFAVLTLPGSSEIVCSTLDRCTLVM